MKIGKAELKSLIKECLLEVLTEGLGEKLVESIRHNNRLPLKQQQNITQKRRPEPVRQPTQSTALLNAIQEAAGKDDIMKDIFADTALTTLPNMLNERQYQQPTGQGVEDQIVAKHEPADIFGSENVDKWAQLAFASGHRSPK